MTTDDTQHAPGGSIPVLAGTTWWLVLLRGALLLLFGVAALVNPRLALLALVLLFGIYAILDGLVAVALGIATRKTASHPVWPIGQGVLSVVAGLLALLWPGITALALLYLIVFWAIIMGGVEIGEAVMARQAGADSWGWTLGAGIVAVLFGLALLIWPTTGILTLVWLLGVFGVVGGLLVIGWAFRVRATSRGATGRTTQHRGTTGGGRR
jgi:uncharacterized membrane protein HdeD (DUF308 family)